jgi:hypothetical protein
MLKRSLLCALLCVTAPVTSGAAQTQFSVSPDTIEQAARAALLVAQIDPRARAAAMIGQTIFETFSILRGHLARFDADQAAARAERDFRRLADRVRRQHAAIVDGKRKLKTLDENYTEWRRLGADLRSVDARGRLKDRQLAAAIHKLDEAFLVFERFAADAIQTRDTELARFESEVLQRFDDLERSVERDRESSRAELDSIRREQRENQSSTDAQFDEIRARLTALEQRPSWLLRAFNGTYALTTAELSMQRVGIGDTFEKTFAVFTGFGRFFNPSWSLEGHLSWPMRYTAIVQTTRSLALTERRDVLTAAMLRFHDENFSIAGGPALLVQDVGDSAPDSGERLHWGLAGDFAFFFPISNRVALVPRYSVYWFHADDRAVIQPTPWASSVAIRLGVGARIMF